MNAAEKEELLVTARVHALKAQIATAKVSSSLAIVSFGILFVPTVGLLPFLVWAALMLTSFWLRNRMIDAMDGQNLVERHADTRIAISSSFLGFVISAPAILFLPQLPLEFAGFYVTLLVAWCVVSVLILGINPLGYSLFVLIMFSMLTIGMWKSFSPPVALSGTIGCVLVALILVAFSRRITAVFDESVLIRNQNDDLVEQLTRAQMKRSQFLASMAHDLLQPIHALMLLTNVAAETTKEMNRAKALNSIQLTASTIENMFRGILDLERLDLDEFSPKLSSIRPAVVLRSIEAAYAVRCANKGILLTVDCSDELTAYADSALFDRVIRNLVDNAVKFTEQGEIHISASQRANITIICVQDTGIGIRVEDQHRILEPFERSQEEGRASTPGIGLGLAVANQLTELMNGTLELKSTLGEGTTVRIALQSSSDIDSETTTHPSARELPKSVLIVEDDAAAGEAMNFWLSDKGVDCRLVNSIEAALQLLDRGDFFPEHLLVDFHLPGIDGVQGINKLRNLRPAIPATVVTGHQGDLGVLPKQVSILRKPIQPETLYTALNQVNAAKQR